MRASARSASARERRGSPQELDPGSAQGRAGAALGGNRHAPAGHESTAANPVAADLAVKSLPKRRAEVTLPPQPLRLGPSASQPPLHGMMCIS